MKKSILTLLLAAFALTAAHAYNEIRAYNPETGEKGLYLPDVWKSGYTPATGEYTYDGVSYSVARSRESDNFVVFWSGEYGTTAPDQLAATDFYYVDIDYMLEQAENFYRLYTEELGFVNPEQSTTLSRYKCMICLIHTTTWMAYGGGYDYVVPALWINPSTCKPIGHTVAHEIGHAFHYMCFAEAAGHRESTTVNTGFHLRCGNGQSIWEQTAQWQAANAFPAEMFSQSYPLFGNCANYAFSHEWMRYQSYWFHYYLCDRYGDRTTVGRVWNQPMTGQTDGTASDFPMALMALKGLTAEQFFELYHDYAMHCAAFDFSAARDYRSAYIGKFDYHAVRLGEEKYQVSYSSAPQCTGFNVVELAVPAAGTAVTTRLTGLKPGCALADRRREEIQRRGPTLGTRIPCGLRVLQERRHDGVLQRRHRPLPGHRCQDGRHHGNGALGHDTPYARHHPLADDVFPAPLGRKDHQRRSVAVSDRTGGHHRPERHPRRGGAGIRAGD